MAHHAELARLAEQMGHNWPHLLALSAEQISSVASFPITEEDRLRVVACIQEHMKLREQIYALSHETEVRKTMVFSYWDSLIAFVHRIEEWAAPIDGHPQDLFILVKPDVVAQYVTLYDETLQGYKKLREAIENLVQATSWSGVKEEHENCPDFARDLLKVMAQKKEGVTGSGKKADDGKWKEEVCQLVDTMFATLDNDNVREHLMNAILALGSMELIDARTAVAKQQCRLTRLETKRSSGQHGTPSLS